MRKPPDTYPLPSRSFLCFPCGKRTFLTGETYISHKENLRFRLGKPKTRKGVLSSSPLHSHLPATRLPGETLQPPAKESGLPHKKVKGPHGPFTPLNFKRDFLYFIFYKCAFLLLSLAKGYRHTPSCHCHRIVP